MAVITERAALKLKKRACEACEVEKKKMWRKVFFLVFLCSCATVGAQDDKWNERIQQLSFLGGRTASDYRLGSGDLIEVAVFGVKDFSYTLRISSSGTITLPFVGAIEAEGLTAAELEQRLGSILGDRLIKNPQVSVFVKEYRSQPIFILGAVKRPGQYQITQALSLIDAIAMAEGLELEKASDKAILQRSHPSPNGNPNGKDMTHSPRQERIEINLKDLLENGILSLNIPVQGGDVIHIPERQVELFYVIGEVGRTGAFAVPRDEKLLITQALAWAGGPLKTAKMNKGILVRYDTDGKREQMAINFQDILKGRKPEIEVQARDIIFIPGSTAKNIAYGLLGVIPGTVSQAVIYSPILR